MAITKAPGEVKGFEFRHSVVSGPYSSLMTVDVYKADKKGRLKKQGRQRILGIAHTSEVVRVGLFRRRIATLHFDPVTSNLSIEE